MIVWLEHNLGTRGRLVVTVGILSWLIFMTWLSVSSSDRLHKQVDAQFRELKSEHRETKEYMIRNMDRLRDTTDRNTDATRKTSQAAAEVHELKSRHDQP